MNLQSILIACLFATIWGRCTTKPHQKGGINTPKSSNILQEDKDLPRIRNTRTIPMENVEPTNATITSSIYQTKGYRRFGDFNGIPFDDDGVTEAGVTTEPTEITIDIQKQISETAELTINHEEDNEVIGMRMFGMEHTEEKPDNNEDNDTHPYAENSPGKGAASKETAEEPEGNTVNKNVEETTQTAEDNEISQGDTPISADYPENNQQNNSSEEDHSEHRGEQHFGLDDNSAENSTQENTLLPEQMPQEDQNNFDADNTTIEDEYSSEKLQNELTDFDNESNENDNDKNGNDSMWDLTNNKSETDSDFESSSPTYLEDLTYQEKNHENEVKEEGIGFRMLTIKPSSGPKKEAGNVVKHSEENAQPVKAKRNDEDVRAEMFAKEIAENVTALLTNAQNDGNTLTKISALNVLVNSKQLLQSVKQMKGLTGLTTAFLNTITKLFKMLQPK